MPPASSIVTQYGVEMGLLPVFVGAVEKRAWDASLAVRLVVNHDDGRCEVEIVDLQLNKYVQTRYAEKCQFCSSRT